MSWWAPRRWRIHESRPGLGITTGDDLAADAGGLYVLKGPTRLVRGQRDLRIAEGKAVQFPTPRRRGEELHLER
jgi:hypothetical protein